MGYASEGKSLPLDYACISLPPQKPFRMAFKNRGKGTYHPIGIQRPHCRSTLSSGFNRKVESDEKKYVQSSKRVGVP
jgi:hypothetical protein